MRFVRNLNPRVLKPRLHASILMDYITISRSIPTTKSFTEFMIFIDNLMECVEKIRVQSV